jgi:hypothetical protein
MLEYSLQTKLSCWLFVKERFYEHEVLHEFYTMELCEELFTWVLGKKMEFQWWSFVVELYDRTMGPNICRLLNYLPCIQNDKLLLNLSMRIFKFNKIIM